MMTQKLVNHRTYAAQPGTLYLLRPDGQIAVRGLSFPLDQLADTLQLANGWKMPGVAAKILLNGNLTIKGVFRES